MVFPTAANKQMDTIIQQQIFPVLSPSIRNIIQKSPPSLLHTLEEIRLRQGQPLQVCTNQGDSYLNAQGQSTFIANKGYFLTGEDIDQTLQLLTRSSLYALEEELRRGYLTITGGHRVGLAGRTVLSPSGSIQTMKNISHINIRIAREIPGAADTVKQYLVNPAGCKLYNTLIISPPQCGKTTLLRDIVRQISDGVFHPKLEGKKVGLVDERSELAGCVKGIPQHIVGSRTDVLDACPKAEGMLMMIRSMSPQVLATDEIGREEDRNAIMEAVYAGVTVIATAHGLHLTEIKNRPAIGALFDAKAFSRYLVLSRRSGPITLEGVFDKDGHCLFQRERRSEWSN